MKMHAGAQQSHSIPRNTVLRYSFPVVLDITTSQSITPKIDVWMAKPHNNNRNLNLVEDRYIPRVQAHFFPKNM